MRYGAPMMGWCRNKKPVFCAARVGAGRLRHSFCAAMGIAVLSLVPQAGLAIVFDAVDVQGNQRIQKATIQSFLSVFPGQDVSMADLNGGIKKLYETGLFSDVRLIRDDPVLRVEVVENPIVNEVAFEGNKRIEDEKLSPEMALKPRAVYTRTKLQQDVQRIQEIYRRQGRFAVEVKPQAISLDQNRLNIVFEIEEGPVSRVQEIRFIGNHAFSDSDLRDAIRTEETAWWKFFSSDDTYDPDRLEFDKELLRRHYTQQGYADFQVTSATADITPDRSAFHITFTVEEGPLYRLGKIAVESEVGDVPNATLQEEVLTESGEKYNAETIEKSMEALNNKLGSRGYAFTEVEPELQRHPEEGVIDLTYRVSEGPKVYVDRINIIGNLRTEDEVIRRELRLAEGDPFSTTRLKRSEQRLRNLGFFEKVTVNNTPGSAPDKTDVNIEVEEQSTGELTFGVGYSTSDGALGDVGLRENNLLGRGQQLRVRATVAQERQEVDMGFTEPYFLGKDLQAGFDLFRYTQDLRSESSYDRDSRGGKVRFGYDFTEYLSHGVYYSLREDIVENVEPNASRFIQEQEGQRLNSAIGHALTYDRRDNRFDPREGYVLRLSQEMAGLGGDARYLQNEFRGSYYYSLIEDWVLSLGAKSGYIVPLGRDIRINDRFFIGARSFRGFDQAGIGPRDRVTRDALGGNVYYVGTAELGFPLGLPDELGFRGAFFSDVGSLWQVDEPAYGLNPNTNQYEKLIEDDRDLRVSVGVGLAWSSPFGPLRIDLAKALVKNDYDETRTFQFSFGTRF